MQVKWFTCLLTITNANTKWILYANSGRKTKTLLAHIHLHTHMLCKRIFSLIEETKQQQTNTLIYSKPVHKVQQLVVNETKETK